MKLRRGSVLLEGVLVLPLWLIIFGGIMSIGQKGIDSLRVKGAERFSVESAITRAPVKGPGSLLLLASDAFRDRGYAMTKTHAVRKKKNSYLTMVGGRAELIAETAPGLFADMMAQPMYGIEKGFSIESLTSSRKGNDYSAFLIVRSKRTTLSQRHWDASLVVDKKVYAFDDKCDDNNDYPSNWNADFFGGKDSTTDEADDPDMGKYAIKKLYSRYGTYIDWSGKAEDK